MSNQQRIDDLVDKKVYEQLDKLIQALEKTDAVFAKSLVNANELRDQLSKMSLSYKDIIDAITRYEKIMRQLQNTNQNSLNLQNQIIRLNNQITNAQTDEAREIERLRQQLTQLNRERRNEIQVERSQIGSLNEMRATLSQLRNEFNSLGAGARRDELGERIRSLNRDVLELERSTGMSQRNVGNYLTKLGASFSVFAGNLMATGVTMFVNALKGGVATIVEFEKANSFLAAVLGDTNEKMKELEQSAISVSRVSRYTASEVTKLQTELAKLGFSSQEIKNSQVDILNFATALQADLPDAAKLAGATLRIFGASSAESERYLTAMTNAAYRSAASFEYFATAMPILGPIAKTFNLSIEDTSTLLGQVANSGFNASMGATALRNILINLADTNGKLARSIGEPVKNFDDLVVAFKKLKEQNIDLSQAFELTDKRSVAVFKTLVDNVDSLELLRKAVEATQGQLQDLADKQLDNVAGSLDLLKSSWEALMLSFSSSTGVFKKVIDWIASLIDGLSELIGGIEATTGFSKKIEGEYKATYQIAEKEGKRLFFGTDKEKETARKWFDDYEKMLENQIKKEADIWNQRNENRKLSEKLNIKIGVGTDYAKFKDEEDAFKTTIASLREQRKALNDAIIEGSKPIKKTEDTEGGSNLNIPAGEKEAKAAAKEAERRREEEVKAENKLQEFMLKTVSETDKAIYENKKESYDERIAALNLYVQKEKALIDQTEDDRKRELDLKKGKMTQKAYNAELLLIREKANADRIKIDIDANKTSISIQEDNYKRQYKLITAETETRKKEVDKQTSDALLAASRQYTQGVISKKDYENEKKRIARQADLEEMQAQIDAAEKMLAILDLTTEQREEILRKLGDARIEYERYVNRQIITDEETANEERNRKYQEALDRRKKYIDNALDVSDALFERQTKNRLKEIDKEKEANSVYYDEEQSRIERLAEAGAITDEDASTRKDTLAEQEKLRENQLEQMRKDTLMRQAKYEKAMAITRITVDTGVAIMKQLSITPLPFGAPLVAAIAAAGAAQLATVLAQGLPQYAKGTGDHKGGYAVLGDGGKHEVVVTPSGQVSITDDKPFIADLPAHSKVFPDIQTAIDKSVFRNIFVPSDGKDIVVVQENKKQISLAERNNRQTQKLIQIQRQMSNNQMYLMNSNNRKKTGRA